MAEFASDTFAGTEGALLDTYSAAWTKHVAGSATTAEIASGRVRGTANGATMYYHSGAPANADYSVLADVYEASDPTAYAAGVVGRMDTTAVTGYMARHVHSTGGSADAWQLYKFVAGTFTQLGSNSTDAITTGTSARVELRMEGTTIALYKRGEATPTISVTDSAVTAAGKAGIRLGYSGSNTPSDTTLYHLDNFSAVGGVSGTLALTNSANSLSAAGALIHSGTLVRTAVADTLEAEGSVGSGAVTGTLATNAGTDTLSAAGAQTHTGTLAYVNVESTLSAIGEVSNTGSLARTNATDTLAATGLLIHAGALGVTTAADTVVAAGSVGSSVSGTLAVTAASDTLFANNAPRMWALPSSPAAPGKTFVYSGATQHLKLQPNDLPAPGKTFAYAPSTQHVQKPPIFRITPVVGSPGGVVLLSIVGDIFGTLAVTARDDTALGSRLPFPLFQIQLWDQSARQLPVSLISFDPRQEYNFNISSIDIEFTAYPKFTATFDTKD